MIWLIINFNIHLFLGLGISACSYYGRVQQECNLSAVEVEILPKECTSFVYDGLIVNLVYEITDSKNATVEST